jgi:hypothetical protein
MHPPHTCSKASSNRCVAPVSVCLAPDHFRSAAGGRLVKTCCYCRGLPAPPVPPRTPSRPQRKRQDPPSRVADPATGFTPSTSRAQAAPHRPVSPSPNQPAQIENIPDLTHVADRPTRIRRAPRHFDSTPPEAPPPPAPVPRQPRIPGPPRPPPTTRKCSGCHRRLEFVHFSDDHGHRIYRTCSTCRHRTREAHSSSAAPSSQAAPSSPGPPDVQPSPPPLQPSTDLDALFLEQDRIDLINSFTQRLDQIHMQHCGDCKERWFDILDKHGKCQQCKRKPGKFTAANNMDPGESSSHIQLTAYSRPNPSTALRSGRLARPRAAYTGRGDDDV